jgi:hypothetical protein
MQVVVVVVDNEAAAAAAAEEEEELVYRAAHFHVDFFLGLQLPTSQD